MLSRKFPNDSFQMLHLFFPCVFTCPYSSFLLLSHLIPTHREKVQLAAPLTEAMTILKPSMELSYALSY